MSFQTSALLLSWVAILLLALVVSGLVRQVHMLSTGARPAGVSAGSARHGQPVGLRPGSPAPAFSVLAPERPGPMMLLFLSPECEVCAELLDETAARAGRSRVTVRALYRAHASSDVPSKSRRDASIEVLTRQDALFEQYDAIATPFAALIDPTGHVVLSEPVGSRAALVALLERADPPQGGQPAGRDDPIAAGHSRSPGGT